MMCRYLFRISLPVTIVFKRWISIFGKIANVHISSHFCFLNLQARDLACRNAVSVVVHVTALPARISPTKIFLTRSIKFEPQHNFAYSEGNVLAHN